MVAMVWRPSLTEWELNYFSKDVAAGELLMAKTAMKYRYSGAGPTKRDAWEIPSPKEEVIPLEQVAHCSTVNIMVQPLKSLWL